MSKNNPKGRNKFRKKHENELPKNWGLLKHEIVNSDAPTNQREEVYKPKKYFCAHGDVLVGKPGANCCMEILEKSSSEEWDKFENTPEWEKLLDLGRVFIPDMGVASKEIRDLMQIDKEILKKFMYDLLLKERERCAGMVENVKPPVAQHGRETSWEIEYSNGYKQAIKDIASRIKGNK